MAQVYSEYFEIFSEYGNLQGIQESIDAAGGGLRFEEFLWNVLSGEVNFDFNVLLDLLGNVAFSGINGSMPQIFRIVGIALVAAVFSNFSFSFRESNVADTAFYVCYLVLYGILALTFSSAYDIAMDAISHITGFMKVLVPSYCIAIALGNGVTTSLGWYESVMIAIALAENVLLKMVLPLIGVHMTVNLAGNISNENILSKLCELLEQFVLWGLKGMTVIVCGMSGFQSLLSTSVDRVKRTTLLKSAGSIPGIGSIIEGVNETLLGSAVLLKDAFGVGGMLALIIIAIVPLVRLCVFSVVYKAEAAVIQPVSDRRIVLCLNVASKASALLMKTVFAAMTFFMAAIAMVAYSSL